MTGHELDGVLRPVSEVEAHLQANKVAAQLTRWQTVGTIIMPSINYPSRGDTILVKKLEPPKRPLNGTLRSLLCKGYTAVVWRRTRRERGHRREEIRWQRT